MNDWSIHVFYNVCDEILQVSNEGSQERRATRPNRATYHSTINSLSTFLVTSSFARHTSWRSWHLTMPICAAGAKWCKAPTAELSSTKQGSCNQQNEDPGQHCHKEDQDYESSCWHMLLQNLVVMLNTEKQCCSGIVSSRFHEAQDVWDAILQ